MKVKTGCIVTDIRGGLGNLTVSRNAYGLFAREIVTPLDPVSTFKTSMRLQFKQVSQAWRLLSEAQRNTFHRNCILFTETNVFCESSKINGFNLFMRLNYNRSFIFSSILNICPPPSITPSVSSFTVSAVASLNRITVIYIPLVPVNHYLFVYASNHVSAGLSQNSVDYKLIQSFSRASNTTLNIRPNHFERFPSPLVFGEKIFVKLCVLNYTTGIMSLPAYSYSIIS